MRHHQEIFASVRRRTGMYLQQETYAVVAAFVLGFDQAYEGGVLVGFREWLATCLMVGSNLSWPALVLQASFPNTESPEDAVHANAKSERLAIETLFDLLDEFEKVRSKPNGLQDVFLAYQRWMLSQREVQ